MHPMQQPSSFSQPQSFSSPHGPYIPAYPPNVQSPQDKPFAIQNQQEMFYHQQHVSGPPMPPIQSTISEQFSSMNLSAPPNSYNSVQTGQPPQLSLPHGDHAQFNNPPNPQFSQPYEHSYAASYQSQPMTPPQPPTNQYVSAPHPPMPPMPPMPPQPSMPQTTMPSGHATGGYNYGGPPHPPSAIPNYPPDSQFAHSPNHPNYVNGMAAGPPQPTKRLSADGMPSAIEVIESDRTLRAGCFLTGSRSCCPPLVTTDFSCRDEGNCNPRFMRSSLYAVPTTADLLKTVGVPFTLTISPFASLHPSDPGIMISDMGPQGPVRCVRCKAYMNPFATFIDGGRRFQCPLCGGLTEVAAEYFAHLDHTGRRTDTFQRPELCLGSFELVATAEYCKGNELPQAPAFIFLLDVSQSSVRSGLVHLFCSRFVEDILPHLPREQYDGGPNVSPLRVGFITYDHQLHFYSMSHEVSPLPMSGDSVTSPNSTAHAALGKPQMHIVSDTADVFVPSVEGFLVPPDPGLLSSVLQLIPAQFGAAGGEPSSQPPDSMLGPAIQAGLEALRAAKRPGKLFVLNSGLPTAEAPGKLKNRDDRRAVGTEREKNLLNPGSDFYTGLGQACVEAGCSVDLFLFPNSYTDVATLGEVPRLTSGGIYKYNCFQADLQGDQFLTDLAYAVSRTRAFNAVMRVRTSTGVRPVDFLGNFHLPNTTDMELACVDESHGFTVEIRHDDKLPDGDVIFIQVACLYTSMGGQRRIRVHNLSLATTNSAAEVFRLVDLDAHMNWLIKSAVRSCFNRSQSQIEDELTGRVASSLAAYRRHCCTAGQGASPGELVLPENMKLYPLYTQCLMKTDALRSATDISIDDRSWLIFLVNAMDVKQSNIYLYPRVYPVSHVSISAEGEVIYPTPVRCSYERLQPDSTYLLENGINLFLWLGTNTPIDWMQAIFGVQNVHNLEVERVHELPVRDNELSRNLCHLISSIRADRSRHLKLLVVRQSEKSEMWFKRFMYEDRVDGNSMSYVEYLCHVHKEVRSLLR